MKKLLFALVLSLLLNGVVALAVDIWHPVDSVTIAWDAALLIDGSPVPDGDILTYYVYTKNEDGSDQKLIGNTNVLQFTVLVPVDAKIFVGVSAQRTMQDGSLTEESDINWSDTGEDNQDDMTFGLSNIRSAASPGGLRPTIK